LLISINNHAFTIPYKNIVKSLWCEVQVIKSSEIKENVPIEEQKTALKVFTYPAIWDTGASNSVITENVVRDLQLEITGMSPVMTASGKTNATLHTVDIWLPNGIGFRNIQVSKGVLGDGLDVLLGMDIVSHGDLTVSNFKGETVLSFRIPSAGITDYTNALTPSRNAPCPCGSGKKYKHCHGKNK
jgi:hypothetical protein